MACFVVWGICALCCANEPVKPPQSAVPPLAVEAPKALDGDQIRVFAEMARKIEATMALKASPPQMRDPDGRLGIFIDCSQPFLAPPATRGMDMRKTWVLLAIFATVTSTESHPVIVDYIGFTDPEGANGKRWFYELDMSAARQIQKEIFSGAITMEQGYEKVIAAWRRVTRT